jgi:predicted Zn-dependent protease
MHKSIGDLTRPALSTPRSLHSLVLQSDRKANKPEPTSLPTPISAANATSKPVSATPPSAPKVDRTTELRPWLNLLSDELQHYWKLLQKQPEPRAYYMKYALYRGKQAQVVGEDGVILRKTDQRKHPVYNVLVDIRVGDHKLDNTGDEGFDWRASQHFLTVSNQLPRKLDTETMRKRLWQLTDVKFKTAVAQYNRKRYVRSLEVEIKDKSGDFSQESPVQLEQLPPSLAFDIERWQQVAREVSAFSLKNQRVVHSNVTISAQQEAIAMVDNSGSRIIKHKTLYRYSIHIVYLSEKNEYLQNMRLGFYDREAGLPDQKQLHELTQKTLQELIDQSNAPEGMPAEAPAILMPDVAGVLFHEALGHRLEGQRMLRESDGRTFRRQIGQRVIPQFLSVIDDPTLQDWRGEPLNGHYLVDDEGVRSRRVVLIEDGILRGFLMSRKPLDDFKSSSGHGRGNFGATPFSRQGNLIISSKNEHNFEKLREMLIEETRRQGKPYGFIIDRASGGYTHTGTYGIQSFKNRPMVVYRVDAKTGEQTLVKGLEMIGTPLTVVNNILATGKDYGIFNGYCGAESGWVPVSAVAPSVLLKTVELQRIQIEQRKFFLLPPPPALSDNTATTRPAKLTQPPNTQASPATNNILRPVEHNTATTRPAKLTQPPNTQASPATNNILRPVEHNTPTQVNTAPVTAPPAPNRHIPSPPAS